MKMKSIWLSWLYMFILCAVLGFIPEPTGFFKFLFVVAAVAFFVPGFVLLTKADHRDELKTIRIVRNLSMGALALSVAMILLNFVSVLLSKDWGTVLYYMMVVLASPLVCGQYWVLTLFLWACLMFYAISLLKKRN
jgi:hypothetical protein